MGDDPSQLLDDVLGRLALVEAVAAITGDDVEGPCQAGAPDHLTRSHRPPAREELLDGLMAQVHAHGRLKGTCLLVRDFEPGRGVIDRRGQAGGEVEDTELSR